MIVRPVFFIAFSVLPMTTTAQTDTSARFEAASLKPSIRGSERQRGMRGGPGTRDPGQITFGYTSLKNLVLFAYGIKYYELIAPAWLDLMMYDLTAKLAPGTTQDQVAIMLRNLLADRFKLVMHHERRGLPAYILRTDKRPPRITPSPELLASTPGNLIAEGSSPDDRVGTSRGRLGPDGFPEGRAGLSTIQGRSRLVAHRMTIRDLIRIMSSRLDRPVVDRTSLHGYYDFTMYWTNDRLPAGKDAVDDAANGPSLLVAVRQQLGFKIESKRFPFEVWVVDHAEKVPVAN